MCLDLKVRCNDLFECSDGSDEQNCEPLLINMDSYRKILPNYSMGKKTNIQVISELHSIKDVDQLSMTFLGELKIILHWKDVRITFKDLKPNGTFLNRHWKFLLNIFVMRPWLL